MSGDHWPACLAEKWQAPGSVRDRVLRGCHMESLTSDLYICTSVHIRASINHAQTQNETALKNKCDK